MRRSDFAFKFLQHIENHGGINSVLDALPSEEDGYSCRPLIRDVFHESLAGGITYRQYFMSLGTLCEYEVI
jgi:hypothetical protein